MSASAVADFPDPDSPTSASDSLWRMENETSRTALSKLPPAAGNAIFKLRTSRSTFLILFGNWVICNLVIDCGSDGGRQTALDAFPITRLPNSLITKSLH